MVENLIEFQVDNKAKFDDIADMDWLIFLGGYQAELAEQQVSGKNSTKKSKKVSNFGFVFSTKRLLTDCVTALSLHADTGVCTGFELLFTNLARKNQSKKIKKESLKRLSQRI